MSEEPEMYTRYRQDARLLSEIGRALEGQATIPVVSIPGHLASGAIAAWNRDELDALPVETSEQQSLRLMAADLALIGLTLNSTGEPDVDGNVRVQIDSHFIESALAASRLVPPH